MNNMEFASRWREDVENWLKFHGLIPSNGKWFVPFSNTEGTITFEEHYWKGTIIPE